MYSITYNNSQRVHCSRVIVITTNTGNLRRGGVFGLGGCRGTVGRVRSVYPREVPRQKSEVPDRIFYNTRRWWRGQKRVPGWRYGDQSNREDTGCRPDSTLKTCRERPSLRETDPNLTVGTRVSSRRLTSPIRNHSHEVVFFIPGLLSLGLLLHRRLSRFLFLWLKLANRV